MSLATLYCLRPLKPEFQNLSRINLDSSEYKIGRGLHNSAVIPFVGISRSHCIFTKKSESSWSIKDVGSVGIQINRKSIPKNVEYDISDKDVIQLDTIGEFIYTFHLNTNSDEQPIAKKRKNDSELDIRVQSAKDNFQASQSLELNNMNSKLQNTQQMMSDIESEKRNLESQYIQSINNLAVSYENKLKNLKGNERDIDVQKKKLIEEENNKKDMLKLKRENQIAELETKIAYHKSIHTLLSNENIQLQKRLKEDRLEFERQMKELTNAKQKKMDVLENELKKTNYDFQEQMNLKEMELQKIKSQLEMKKKERSELRVVMVELDNNLPNHSKAIEQNRTKNLKEAREKTETLRAEKDDEISILSKKYEALQKEKNTIEEKSELEKTELLNKLNVREKEKMTLSAKLNSKTVEAQNCLKELEKKLLMKDISLKKSEIENVKLKAKLDNKKQSSKVIEKKPQQQNVDPANESSSCLNMLQNQLECSICLEIFIQPISLNCGHTFCEYCLKSWKQKNMVCPICRKPIDEPWPSIVIQSLIDSFLKKFDKTFIERRQNIIEERIKSNKRRRRPAKSTVQSVGRSTRARTRNGNFGEQ